MKTEVEIKDRMQELRGLIEYNENQQYRLGMYEEDIKRHKHEESLLRSEYCALAWVIED
jgi:hypothetical protein